MSRARAVHRVVADGRIGPGRLVFGDLCEGCGDPFRRRLNTGRVFHQFAELNDVRHEVVVEEGVVVEGHFEGISQRIASRAERCPGGTYPRGEVECVSSAWEGVVALSQFRDA